MKQDKEIRYYGDVSLNIEERATDKENRRVRGYAAVYSRYSEDFGQWREIIDPGAFDGVAEVSDIFALLNHDRNRGVLARSREGNGSLTVRADDKGLYYEFDAPQTALGDELLEGLRRGDISQSSFAFTVQDERWEKQQDNTYVRHIVKVDRLYDVSPVYTPAYPDTTVANRALSEVKEKETPKPEPANTAPTAEYWQELEAQI